MSEERSRLLYITRVSSFVNRSFPTRYNNNYTTNFIERPIRTSRIDNN